MSIHNVGTAKEKAALMAERTLGSTFLPKDDLWDTLSSVSWTKLCTGSYSQHDLAEMNLELDPRSCLGRLALMVYLVERYFPSLMSLVRCAEVRRDFFRQLMLKQWGPTYDSGRLPPESWLMELLMYEDPHSIMSVGGRQCDPLFYAYAEVDGLPVGGMAHPSVHEFSPWEAIVAFQMVAEASLLTDPVQAVAILREAEKVCPGTCLVRQNIVGQLVLLDGLDDIETARQVILWLCNTTTNARVLLASEMFFGQSHPAKNAYDPCLWSLLVAAIGRSLS